jgi:hypothetical protein
MKADEVLVPRVHLVQVGVAAGGEGPALVQRHRRAVVGAQQAAGIGRAGRRREVKAVHRVAPVRGQLDAVPRLGAPRPRLGELPREPADLDDGNAGAVRQHDRHLQQGLQLGVHGLGGRARERLGAVAALQHERLAAGHRGQPVPELVALAGEDQRRQGGQLGGHGRQRGGIGPVGLLPGRAGSGRGGGHAVRPERVCRARRCARPSVTPSRYALRATVSPAAGRRNASTASPGDTGDGQWGHGSCPPGRPAA